MQFNEANSRPYRQIRALSGPLRGTAHSIQYQLHIGRAGSSDIQLIDEDVSRQHAEVIENVYGDHVLVDLDSANGTLIDGQPIRRVKLMPGMTFEIMRTKFIYEDAYQSGAESEHQRPRGPTDMRSLRATTHYGASNTPVPALNPKPMQHNPHKSLPLPSDQSSRSMRAIDSEGVAYQGNLIGDVRDYRQLLSRSMRGLVDTDEELQHLEVLESRLRQPSPSGHQPCTQVGYRRFYCSVPTQVRFSGIGSIPAMIIDFGVDGAQILSYQHGLPVNSIVWLSLDVVHEGHERTLVFTSRVQWSNNNYAGLLFIGEPIQSDRDHEAEHTPTKYRLLEQADRIRAALGPLEYPDCDHVH